MKQRMQVQPSGLRSGLILVCALAASAGAGEAQEAQLGIFAGRSVDERGDAHAAVTVAPSVTWSAPGSAVGLSGQATLFQHGGVFGMGRVWGSQTLVAAGPGVIAVDGEGSLGRSDADYRALRAGLHPRARVGGSSWAVETGPHLAVAEGTDGVGLVRSPLNGGVLGTDRPAEGSSGMRVERGWRVAGIFDREAFGITNGWRVVELEGQRWGEWTAEAALAFQHVIVSASGGGRIGALQEEWLAGRLIGRLGSSTSILLEGGRSPSDPHLRRKCGRYAALGLVLRTGPRP